MTLADAGFHEEAAARLAESIAAGEPAESHLRKVYALYASCLAELGRHPEALRACLDGLAHYPDDAELNFRAGLTSHRLGRPADAVAFYRDAMQPPAQRAFASVDRGISSYKALFNMAAAMLDLGDVGGAEQAYREVVRLAPDWEPGRRALADFLAEQKPIDVLGAAELRDIQLAASTECQEVLP
jgi:tetratricopeptide (TPR) repeat protein